MTKKLGVWIILILTSLALIIPSVAILYNLLTQEKKVSVTPVTINSDDIQVSVETAKPSPSPASEALENEGIPVVSNIPAPTSTTVVTSTGEITK